MTIKHTPGPWRTVGGTEVRSGIHILCDTELTAPTNESGQRRAKADAALIAAAPDLLKALQKFIDVMESCSYYPDTASDRHALCQSAVKAKAAIAKATGE